MNSSLRMRALLVSLALLSAVPSARAQEPLPAAPAAETAEARADALFHRGKEQLGKQDYAAACPLLAESFALDPATGTQLALALCYERAGDVKGAIEQYRGAAARAKREGQSEREQAATQRAEELEAAFAPEPEPQPEPAAVRARGSQDRDEPAPQRTRGLSVGQWIGIGTAGGGAIAFGLAAGLAARAADLSSDSEAGCNGDLCTAEARRSRLDAVSAGNAASLMVLTGAVLVCTGAAIFFSAGSEHEHSYAVTPWLMPDAAGATASAQF